MKKWWVVASAVRAEIRVGMVIPECSVHLCWVFPFRHGRYFSPTVVLLTMEGDLAPVVSSEKQFWFIFLIYIDMMKPRFTQWVPLDSSDYMICLINTFPFLDSPICQLCTCISPSQPLLKQTVDL